MSQIVCIMKYANKKNPIVIIAMYMAAILDAILASHSLLTYIELIFLHSINT